MNRTFESIKDTKIRGAIEQLLQKYDYVIEDIDDITCENQQYHILINFVYFYLVSSMEEAKEMAKEKLWKFISYKVYESFPYEYKKHIIYNCKFHNKQKMQNIINFKQEIDDDDTLDYLFEKFNGDEEELYKFLLENDCIDWELFVPFIIEREGIGDILNSYDASIWLLDGGFIGWREK